MTHIQNYKNRPTILFNNKWQNQSLQKLTKLINLAREKGIIREKDLKSFEQRFRTTLHKSLDSIGTQSIQEAVELICNRQFESLFPKYYAQEAQIYILRGLESKKFPAYWKDLRNELIHWIETDESKLIFFYQGHDCATYHRHENPPYVRILYVTLLPAFNIKFSEALSARSLLKAVHIATTGRKPLADVWQSRPRRKALSIFRTKVINAFASYQEFHKTMDDYYDLCGSLSEGQIERRASHYHAGYSDKDFNFQADSQQHPVPNPPKPPQSIIPLQMLAEARFQREYKKNYE